MFTVMLVIDVFVKCSIGIMSLGICSDQQVMLGRLTDSVAND